MSTKLKTELETFRRELPNLLAEQGNHDKFVLIHGDTVAGIYPDLLGGLQAGRDLYELAPYLVKKIMAHQEPLYFSRNLQFGFATATRQTPSQGALASQATLG